MKHLSIWVIAALGLFIFFFNLLATYWHLFFLIWWLDIPLHILGGMWVALSAFVIYYRSHYAGHKNHSALFVVSFAICTALSVGLLWELYEFVVDRAMATNDIQLADSLKDLFDDFLGGIVAAVIFLRKGYNKHI
jgi:hypothetical protein